MSMVNYAKLITIAVATTLALPALAKDIWPTCAEKVQQIETQLAYAKANHNEEKIAHLNHEKAEVINHCSNDSLRQLYVEKVNKYSVKVDETQQKLIKAQNKGDAKKVSQVQLKLAERKRDLQEAKDKLARFDRVSK